MVNFVAPPSGATFSFGRLPRTELTAMCFKKSSGSEVRGYQLDCLLHHIFEPFWVRFVMYNFLWCLVGGIAANMRLLRYGFHVTECKS